MTKRSKCRGSLLLLSAVVVSWVVLSCSSSIAVFDEHAYENATSLKAETLGLMALAAEPYADHSADAHRLSVRIQAAREYAAGIPKNERSAKQWEILSGPSLIGGFLDLWQTNGKLLSGDLAANRKNVSDAFDEVIRLEAAKIKQ